MRKGIYLVLITAVISGLSIFFNKFALEALGKNAYQYTTLKNIIPAVLLSFLILTPFIFPKLKKLNKGQWLKLFLIGLIGGSVPFLLFFKGMSLTSAVGAAFIHKTLFIWVAILAWPLLKEKLGKIQLLALLILVGSTFIFGGFKYFSWGYAHSLILAATVLWAVESIIAKIILRDLDYLLVAWGRMFFGSLILIGFLVFTKNTGGLLTIDLSQFLWLGLVGLFLTGYVISWYSALQKLPVTVVSSFLVLASPLTTLLNNLFITHQFPSKDILGLATVLVALILLWQFKPIKKYEFNTKSI
ncbi:MAG: DMT family transporter [Candidatus Buchananbacteria bacterium]|nr:DMT family transporter [Candidatus Buchananbacteria bacterium]